MPLVKMLAHRHYRRGAERADLVRAGSVGLLGAIERFDPNRGEEFVAFAVPTVAGEIKRHIRDRTAAVCLPQALQEARARLPQARDRLTARLGRPPTPTELAREVRVTTDELALLLKDARPGGADESATDAGGSELEASEFPTLLAGAFRTLDNTDRTILNERLVRERSRRDVADDLGMSQSALARRTNAALAKLRVELEERAFERPAQPTSSLLSAAPEPGGEAPAETASPSVTAGSATKERGGHSGRLMLRMPQSLHAELAEAAEREEVSLNQFITNTLAAATRWRSDADDKPSTPRWLPGAIVASTVVVLLAGVIALVLLIVAWQQGW